MAHVSYLSLLQSPWEATRSHTWRFTSAWNRGMPKQQSNMTQSFSTLCSLGAPQVGAVSSRVIFSREGLITPPTLRGSPRPPASMASSRESSSEASTSAEAVSLIPFLGLWVDSVPATAFCFSVRSGRALLIWLLLVSPAEKGYLSRGLV